MDAKDGQPQEVFIAQSKGKSGKARGSSGGVIIASKTAGSGVTNSKAKMPSHGQHYLQDASNLACFPYKPRKPNMQQAARRPNHHYDGPEDAMDQKIKHRHRSSNSMTMHISTASQEERIKIKAVEKN